MSKGWTIRVAMDPAERPAIVSTAGRERRPPALLESVIETFGCERRYIITVQALSRMHSDCQ